VPILVHAVVRAGHPIGGVLRETGTRRVDAGAAAAVVVAIPDDAVLDDDDIDAYVDILVALLPDGPVLPVEFGTIAPDEEALRDYLMLMADDLSRRLDLLDGLVEVRVDLVADEAHAIREVVHATPELEHATRAGRLPTTLQDRVALGEQIGFALAELCDALSEQLIARLGKLAVAQATRPSTSVTELRHAYLIRADDLPAFDEAVQEIREVLDETHAIEYVGPLPPFDFTNVELEAGPRRDDPARHWGW
jgi:hypothetical protein